MKLLGFSFLLLFLPHKTQRDKSEFTDWWCGWVGGGDGKNRMDVCLSCQWLSIYLMLWKLIAWRFFVFLPFLPILLFFQANLFKDFSSPFQASTAMLKVSDPWCIQRAVTSKWLRNVSFMMVMNLRWYNIVFNLKRIQCNRVVQLQTTSCQSEVFEMNDDAEWCFLLPAEVSTRSRPSL